MRCYAGFRRRAAMSCRGTKRDIYYGPASRPPERRTFCEQEIPRRPSLAGETRVELSPCVPVVAGVVIRGDNSAIAGRQGDRPTRQEDIGQPEANDSRAPGPTCSSAATDESRAPTSPSDASHATEPEAGDVAPRRRTAVFSLQKE